MVRHNNNYYKNFYTEAKFETRLRKSIPISIQVKRTKIRKGFSEHGFPTTLKLAILNMYNNI